MEQEEIERIQNKIDEGLPSLKDVHHKFKKWMYLKDTRRIDVMLAVAITQKMVGTPVWLIIVGPSGDGKSLQLMPLNDVNSLLLQNFTPKTLVSGKKGVTDLAPQLHNKLMLIPEMAQLLSLCPQDKTQVWSQLRDLYDGFAGKVTGDGSAKSYKDLRVTFIGGSTPVIDNQILIHQSLGTRELFWRTTSKDKDIQDKIMDAAFNNEDYEDTMKNELSTVTQNFLKRNLKPIEMSNEIKKTIKLLTLYLRIMRSSANIDSYTGELLNDVYPEQSSRALKQLVRIYKGLKNLDKDYDDISAINILIHLVKSSSEQNRIRVYEWLTTQKYVVTTYKTAESLKIGKKTAYRELNILWNLGLVDRISKPRSNFDTDSFIHQWVVNREVDFYQINSIIKNFESVADKYFKEIDQEPDSVKKQELSIKYSRRILRDEI